MPTYTRSQLYTDIDRTASTVQNIDDIVNRAVREVIGEIDLRSTKRMAYLSPVLTDEQFDYQAPSDLKDLGLIDIRKLSDRSAEFSLVPSEEFDRRKNIDDNIVCIEDQDFLKKLRIAAELDGDQSVLHEMDDIDVDGTWAVGGSASNLTEDTDNFVRSSASLNFDVAASYTSATLENPDMTAVDLSDYENNGSVFVYVYIPSTTGLTSFKLRVGSSASAYFERTVTVTNENLAFHTGWVLLRFDFASATETGTVDTDNVDYLRLEIVGAGTASATTDWRVDYIVARRGDPHQVWYYSKYGWQTSLGAYLENSTANTDLLNVDTEEYNLIVWKGKEFMAEDLKFFDEADRYGSRYETKRDRYTMRYPSERMSLTSTYHILSSLGGTNSSETT